MTKDGARPAQVKVTENGPYIVTGDVPLAAEVIVTDAAGGSDHWSGGPIREHQDTYALCRCGRSSMKPFCDGSHARYGFDGAETASRQPYMDQAQTFVGPRLRMTDARALCAAARFCDTHGKVWNEIVHTDQSDVADHVRAQVAACPSGRLVVWDATSNEQIEPELPVSIGLVQDPQEQCSGPLWLRGGIPVVSSDGHAYEVRNRVTLCRCGASMNKPFCDGSHIEVRFKDQ